MPCPSPTSRVVGFSVLTEQSEGARGKQRAAPGMISSRKFGLHSDVC
jgi:hypothetical protein